MMSVFTMYFPHICQVYGRIPPVPTQSSNAPRDYPSGRGGFPSGKDLHHFDQDYPSDGMPLEGDDYLGSLGRATSDDDNRNYMFGQQVEIPFIPPSLIISRISILHSPKIPKIVSMN